MAHRPGDWPSSIRRWPTERARKWVCDLMEKAGHDENIAAIIAVGSAVREVPASTDIDLIVVLKEIEKYGNRPPMEVDVRTYKADEVHNLVEQGSDMLTWALVYGVLLFERNEFWRRLANVYRQDVPLPSPDAATERAKKSLGYLKAMISVGDKDAACEQATSYLTHLARAALLRAAIHPASRPELPAQLRQLGENRLADQLQTLIESDDVPEDLLQQVAA